jgi:LPS-assembly protein
MATATTLARHLRSLAALLLSAAAVSVAPAQTLDEARAPGASIPGASIPGASVPGGAPVSLVADRIDIDAEAGTVTATGSVEVFYGGRVLRATRIVYDDAARTISATGPIEIVDADGGVVLADAAALTPDLVEGLIVNARLLIAGNLQLAAAEARRSEGRYTTLFRTVASSCEVCAGDAVPTWAIRAERVIRDEDELQLYFRNATLEVFGIPVAWLPYMRIPDPTVERASGFLVPEVRRSQIYGAGLKLPYYIVLGPSADATVTPFFTQDGGTLIEGQYRRRFADGGFDVDGVIQLDNPLDDRSGRGAFTLLGDYGLGRGFRAEVDVNATSDDQFLEQFDYSSADRLTSAARILRSRSEDYFELGAVGFQSLRPEESSARIPFAVPELRYRRLWQDAAFGGRVGIDVDGLGLVRDEGRDVARFGGGADWRRDWQTGPGILAAATAGAAVDFYRVGGSGPDADSSLQRLAPTVSAEARWPLARAGTGGGALQVVEPIAQLVWTDVLGDETPPNEDSQLPEFDETNLFALDRFPGRDRVESGFRANLGVGYSRHDPAGWTLGVVVGRVLRLDEKAQFTAGTGLDGRSSDWVGAVSLTFDSGLVALNRFRTGGDFEVRRNEFGLAYEGERGALTAAWVYLAEDPSNPVLGIQPESSEISIDARYRILPNWRLAGLWRYDLASDNPIRAGGSLTYGNECAEIDLSVSRRFVSSANVPPSTSIGFVVRLAGLGGSGSEDWPRRACTG